MSDFAIFFDKLSWGALTIVALYIAKQLKDLSKSVSDLNINVAVLVERITHQEKKLDEFDHRIRRLE